MGKLIQGVNDLYTWCMENGDFGQQLIKEWTGQREDGKHYEIYNVSKSNSKYKFLWKCSKGHIFYQRIHDRTYQKTCCIFCSGRKVSNEKNLYSWCLLNGEFGQQLISEWTGICYDGNNYEMKNITKACRKNMLWKCSKGHEWYATVNNRTSNHSTCNKCRYIPDDNNSLLEWCNRNKTLGKTILSQWTGICDDNNHYEINEVTIKSSKNMLWKCNKGHSYYQRIFCKTNGYGCPKCTLHGTSYPEQFLYRALKQIYPQTISRGKYQGYEYDITIPEERTCIEYSGLIWHLDSTIRDEEKVNICKEHNIRLIQIWASDRDIDTEIYDNDYIIYKVVYSIQDIQLIYILNHILKSFNRDISEIDIEKAQTEAFNFMHDIDNKDK